MFKIIKKEILNPTVTSMDIYAPHIAKKANPGQFIILRVDENGERIPLTIADYNITTGTVRIIFQVVGTTTEKLNHKNEGDYILDFVGPLGNKTEIENYKNVAIVGGGVGCAIAYPIAKKLFNSGANVSTFIGFRNKELIILENEFKHVSHELFVSTDDGSYGHKGYNIDLLKKDLENGKTYDLIITIGPLIMMKNAAILTKKYNIKTIASMNPIMIDGTGMCGGCRLTVDGKTKFACVDGPDFNAHQIDFDEAINRNKIYREFEKKSHSDICNLFKKEAIK